MSLKSLPAAKQKLAALGDFCQLDEGFLAGPDSNPGLRRIDGRLVAMNMRTNRIAWQVKWPNDMCYSGVATTAGNLVFVGRNGGYLEAYHARTGKRLWRSPKLKAGVNAAPADLHGERQAVRRRARGRQHDHRRLSASSRGSAQASTRSRCRARGSYRLVVGTLGARGEAGTRSRPPPAQI